MAQPAELIKPINWEKLSRVLQTNRAERPSLEKVSFVTISKIPTTLLSEFEPETGEDRNAWNLLRIKEELNSQAYIPKIAENGNTVLEPIDNGLENAALVGMHELRTRGKHHLVVKFYKQTQNNSIKNVT